MFSASQFDRLSIEFFEKAKFHQDSSQPRLFSHDLAATGLPSAFPRLRVLRDAACSVTFGPIVLLYCSHFLCAWCVVLIIPPLLGSVPPACHPIHGFAASLLMLSGLFQADIHDEQHRHPLPETLLFMLFFVMPERIECPQSISD